MSAFMKVSGFVVIFFLLGLSEIDRTGAEQSCLLSYDTNDTSVHVNLMDLNETFFRGETGPPGKMGPVGPPGPIGGSENDTVLRQRYDDRIDALEARLNDLSDASWYLASNGYRYKVIETPKTYEEAKRHCESIGSHLAATGMRQLRARNEIKQNVVNPVGKSVWIGLDDLQQKFRWQWLDGVASDSENTDWDHAGNEPNNSGGRESCAHMRKSSGRNWRLNDYTCGNQLSSLCEKAI